MEMGYALSFRCRESVERLYLLDRISETTQRANTHGKSGSAVIIFHTMRAGLLSRVRLFFCPCLHSSSTASFGTSIGSVCGIEAGAVLKILTRLVIGVKGGSE
jgi:hypothetical protein